MDGTGLKGREALPLLTISGLKKRGTNNLYLFKTGSFGKESAELGERCSLDLSGKSPRLFIRNISRGSSELKAAPGDLVLAREGEFVGIVTAVEEHGFKNFKQAQVFVFDDNFNWQNAEKIDLTKPAAAKYFDAFAKRMRQLNTKLQKSE